MHEAPKGSMRARAEAGATLLGRGKALTTSMVAVLAGVKNPSARKQLHRAGSPIKVAGRRDVYWKAETVVAAYPFLGESGEPEAAE